MKKNYLFGLLSLFTLLFTASCQEENLVGTSGDTAMVTFEVNTPTLTTRAVGDGTTATKLYVGVYENQNGTAGNLNLVGPLPVSKLGTEGFEATETFTDRVATVNLQLAKNKEYSVIFWAETENNGEAMFDIDWNDRELNLKSSLKANQESYDAFWAQKTVTLTGTISEKIDLKRPFAQLNIGTSDKEIAKAAGIIVDSTEVKTKVFTTFNLQNGKAAGEAEVIYKMEAVKDIKDQAFPAADQEYLSLNYLLMNTDKSIVDVKFSYKDKEDKKTYDLAFTSVPVQRNYRTNIYGTLLTNSAEYTVEILPGFADDKDENDVHNIQVWDGTVTEEDAPVITTDENGNDVAVVSTGSQLAYLAQMLNGGFANNAPATRAGEVNYATMTIVLDADLDLGNEEWLPVGTTSNPFKGTFDGNGFTIHNLKVTGNNSNVGLFGVTHDGEIKNLTISNANVSGRLNVGVVAGQPYTSKYTNITVTGHVEVNGMAYVGGVGGKNAYADWTDITVCVDESSYVNANSVENGTAYRTYVGGVVGFNGEGSHTFSNITSNINVQGSTIDAGGLFGIAHYGNKFENCVCTGNVEIYAAEEAEEAQEIGGIAGVWNNETGYTVTMNNCAFKGNLTTNVEGVNYYYNRLVGSPYSAEGEGKLIIDGEVAVASVEALQTAINAAEGETTIALYADMAGNVTVVQKQGVKITINGKEKKFNGSIKVHSNSNFYADAALTIQDVNFESSAASVNFIEALEKGSLRYSTNITVERCTFTATGEGVNTSVGVQIKASKNAKVLNCRATGVHSLLQAQSCDETVVVNGCTINGKNGVAFKQVKAATVEGTTITATGYGIRFDGNTDNYGITVKDNNITAYQPLIVRKMTGKNNTIKLEGDNTFTTDEEYQIVITNGSDDEEYVKPTGTYTLIGAEKYEVNTIVKVATAEALVAALKDGMDVALANDITIAATSGGYNKAGILQNKAQTIDGRGYTLTVTGAGATWDCAIYTNGGTIKNLTVAGAMRGIFTAGTSADLYIENVTFKNVVYTFNSDGGNKEYGVYVSNSTVNGWTSHSNVHKEVVYTNCSFGEGSGYKFCRPYGPTSFVNCTFCSGYTVDKSQCAEITFTDCIWN